MKLTINRIFDLTPMELAQALSEEMNVKLPAACETPEDLDVCGHKLIELTSNSTTLNEWATMASLKKRMLKRSADVSKSLVEDAIDRENVLVAYRDNMREKYQALSRLITIKQQKNQELLMPGYRKEQG